MLSFKLQGKKILVLDRDGVINNDSDIYIKSTAEYKIINSSLEAIYLAKKKGLKVVVASNQSGISRGYFSKSILSQMHIYLQQKLKQKFNSQIDWICYSPYQDSDNAVCRKPRSGMLRAISFRYNLPFTEMAFVGDSKSDYEAATNLGLEFALVRTGKGQRTLAKHPHLQEQVPIYDNLLSVINNC